jgi:replicative DNA helicase
MTNSRDDDHLHLPARAGRVALSEFTRRSQEQVRFDWGVPILDNYLTPMMRGDMVTVVGRPGHGKTSLTIQVLRRANELLLGEQGVRRYAVYATWETLVEEFVAIRLSYASGQTLQDIGRGRADIEKLERAIAGSVRDRVAVIGQSMEGGTGMPSLASVDAALSRMTAAGTPAAFVVFDYLQRIPGRPGQDRSQMVSENLEAIKDIALRYAIPVVVAVQSKRDVDEYKGLQMPNLADGQWTSNIEQASDKSIGVTRPCLYLEKGKHVEIGPEKFAVTDSLMAIRVNKQRWANSGDVLMLDFNPRTSIIKDAVPMTDDEGEVF